MGIMNRIRNSTDVYDDVAYANLKDIVIALAQISMKKQTEEDIIRLNELAELPRL
jgi:hypothetical protein